MHIFSFQDITEDRCAEEIVKKFENSKNNFENISKNSKNFENKKITKSLRNFETRKISENFRKFQKKIYKNSKILH